ncbi:MAG: DUF4143 domain-containing protein [Spirochaetaceae bacterium]|nr:DUF4143 domain-containing protein [Spirochaetaceae bacterium]
MVSGPPRSGKTVFAEQLVRSGPGGLLLDARSPGIAAALAEPVLCLELLAAAMKTEAPVRLFGARLLVLDNADEEIARAAAAFVAATGPGKPLPPGAAASPEAQSAAAPLPEAAKRLRLVLVGARFPEEVPGRRLELGGLTLPEVGRGSRAGHWLRGGFPEAYGAASDQAALAWLRRYADSVAEERFARAGLPWAPGRTRALLSMLAEAHGAPLNENAAARSLGVSRPTIVRSVRALERAGLVSFLPALPEPAEAPGSAPAGGPGAAAATPAANAAAAPPTAAGKRLVRAPALYLRDSGLLHALLGIQGAEGLLGSARLAASWEGYAIEQCRAVLPAGVESARRRSQDGAGLELVLHRAGRPLLGAAIRWSRAGEPSRGARIAAREIGAESNWLVLPEGDERRLECGFSVAGLGRFLEIVAGL